MVVIKIKKLWYGIHWGKKIFWSKSKDKLEKRIKKLWGR